MSLDQDTILVRYGEIGSKSGYVRDKMAQILRSRVEEKLDYEDYDYEKVSKIQGRVIVRGIQKPYKISKKISDLPGVSSTSPATVMSADKEVIYSNALKLDIGETFGINCRTADTKISGSNVEEELGAKILENDSEKSVDLDYPKTWINIEIRDEEAFLFKETFEGSDGLPVGSQGDLGVLLSGGIDSPVASFLIMKRGSDIHPIYFYNKPLTAEDHKMRLESIIKELKKFHPGKDWSYTLVDLGEINDILLEEVDKGRMVIHRVLMFKIAGEIGKRKGLEGLVTGESLGQKSSQTASNLGFTSQKVDLPVFRPLIGFNKNETTKKAKHIGTYDFSTINSACRSLSPDNPATQPPDYEFREFCQNHDIESLVDNAVRNSEDIEI